MVKPFIVRSNLMALNVKNIRKLARYLDSIPDKNFNMIDWSRKKRGCGTVACIAGWAAHIFPEFIKEYKYRTIDKDSVNYSLTGRKALGLTASQADRLFVGVNNFEGYLGYPRDRSRQDAVKVLRNLAKTRKIRWKD
jgi:hypothetical protein